MDNPIIEEVRKAREQLAADYKYDAHAICAASRERQKTCGHKVVDLSKKRGVNTGYRLSINASGNLNPTPG